MWRWGSWGRREGEETRLVRAAAAAALKFVGWGGGKRRGDG